MTQQEQIPSLDEASEPPAGSRAVCGNCGSQLTGGFCSNCGQSRHSPVVSLRAFASQALGDLANLDSRVVRTLRALLFRPGLLTRDYLDDRRARYTPPVQIYLIAAAVFFLVGSYRPFLWVDTQKREIFATLPGLSIGNDVVARSLAVLPAGAATELFAERFVSAVNGLLPIFLVGSVVAFSLLIYLLHFRLESRYIPHAVFALHWTAFFLLMIAGGRVLPASWRIGEVALVITLIHLILALRRVYRQGILLTVGKGFLLFLGFYLLLAVWIQAAISVGIMSA